MYLRVPALRRQSRFRFTLGMAQMFGAVVSLTLLVETGVTVLTLATLLGTGMLTGLSRLLYRRLLAIQKEIDRIGKTLPDLKAQRA